MLRWAYEPESFCEVAVEHEADVEGAVVAEVDAKCVSYLC